jgi:hypothetical protein
MPSDLLKYSKFGNETYLEVFCRQIKGFFLLTSGIRVPKTVRDEEIAFVAPVIGPYGGGSGLEE